MTQFALALKVALQWLAALMLVAIVLIVLSNVFFRYFLHIGLRLDRRSRALPADRNDIRRCRHCCEGMGSFPPASDHKMDPEKPNSASCSYSPCL